MKPRYLNPFCWLTRFIHLNREIAAAIPPITEEDFESLRKFSEHLNRFANKVDKSNKNEVRCAQAGERRDTRLSSGDSVTSCR
jgi:hypothetical protein